MQRVNVVQYLFQISNILYLFFPDDWLMFDDDNVTPISSEDVLKLSGGGKYDVR